MLRIKIAPLPVPPALVDALALDECVLHAGSELTQIPRKDILEQMVTHARDNKWISETDATSYKSSIDAGLIASTADSLFSDIEPHADKVRVVIKNMFGQLRTNTFHQQEGLKKLPFNAALTTNYDLFLEETFSFSNVSVPSDLVQPEEDLRKKCPFLLKLHGSVNRPETLLLSSAQFEDFMREHPPFAQFLETLCFSKTFLFVGHKLEELEEHFKSLSMRKQDGGRPHFALLFSQPTSGWEPKARFLEKRYGVSILNHASPDSSDSSFLKKLEKEVSVKRKHTRSRAPGVGVKHVTLENIGPFERLELALNDEWNILLGDNGVGKSIILKAIALSICGQDAQSYAHQLVRKGANRASITLKTDRTTYRTEIVMGTTPSSTRLSTIPMRPLEMENWLALGFPPLRTAGWERTKLADVGALEFPNADDLLPLISGGVDPRLERLKQWLISLDHRSKDEKLKGETDRISRLLDEVFEMIGDLVEGVSVRRGEVNPHTSEITIYTNDGPLPLEALSQGTLSLIGWVGVVLQRLYEVYADGDHNPRESYALVLMDEIDAHLHPGWQQALVSKLRKIFPKVQFIASTHSPLIVGGMETEKIIRLERDSNGQVERLSIDPDMMMGRTDQILTTDLFSLRTTLDIQTQRHMAEYQDLLSLTMRNNQEEVRFQELRQILQFRIPPVAENLEDRRAFIVDQERLMQEVAKASESSVKDAGEIKKSEIAYLLKLMSSKDLRSAAKEKEEEEISKTEKRDILEKEREMLERDMKDLHYELDKTMHEMQHLYRIISETSSQKPLNDKESMEHALVNLEHHSLNIRNQLSIIHHRLEVLRQDLES